MTFIALYMPNLDWRGLSENTPFAKIAKISPALKLAVLQCRLEYGFGLLSSTETHSLNRAEG